MGCPVLTDSVAGGVESARFQDCRGALPPFMVACVRLAVACVLSRIRGDADMFRVVTAAQRGDTITTTTTKKKLYGEMRTVMAAILIYWEVAGGVRVGGHRG
eukprot:3280475-Rhodomonas_salina.2